MDLTLHWNDARQHIQNHSEGSHVSHWGYPDRVVPCTNDKGTCEYLDAVYWMHDTSMLYSFIMWAVIAGVLTMFLIPRLFSAYTRHKALSYPQSASDSSRSTFSRIGQIVSVLSRKFFLPESFSSVFGHVSRVQILALTIIAAYLLTFSLVGITYRTWITPIKGSTKFNTRTGIGGWADRVGVLAYALTPLSILLASRESFLSLVTGLPNTSFIFLHAWLGRIIFAQAFLHTLGWTVIQAKLYQPQPTKYKTFMREPYIIWGVVAMFLITFLYLFSIKRVVKKTGYEFFKVTHYITAALYMGACWAHWTPLSCWLIAGIALFFIDRGLRMLRTTLIHSRRLDGTTSYGFKPASAIVKLLTDVEGRQLLRIEFDQAHKPWAAGQHFYLTFPEFGWWQAHPFTPLSLSSPVTESNKTPVQHHVYVVRVKTGLTLRLAQKAGANGGDTKVDVVLAGPYSVPVDTSAKAGNLIAVAGGTGISFVLPSILERLRRPQAEANDVTAQLVWFARHAEDVNAVLPELQSLIHRASLFSQEDQRDSEKPRIGSSQYRLSVDIIITQAAGWNPQSDTKMIDTSSSSASTNSDKVPSISAPEACADNKIGLPALSSTRRASVQQQSLIDVVLSQLSPRSQKIVRISTHTHATRPTVAQMLNSFINSSVIQGPVTVLGSGPASLGTDLRSAVASRIDVTKVKRGDVSGDVRLVWDGQGLGW